MESTLPCVDNPEATADSSSKIISPIENDSIFYILSRCSRNYVYEYNIVTKSLRNLENRPYLCRIDVTKHKNSIYAVSGTRKSEPCDVALKYDITTNTWMEYNLPFTKAFVSLCTVGDQMFVFGGTGTDGDVTNTCSRYDYLTGRWSDLPQMEEYRANSAPILYNNAIYVLGGFSGMDNEKVEVLDPREGKWSTAGRITGGGAVCSAMMGDRICIMNNYTGKYCLYDPKTLYCTEETVFGRRGKQWLCNKGNKLYLLHYDGLDVYDEASGDFINILSHKFVKCPFIM